VRADCLKSLGMAYHMLGRFEQAEEFKSQALQLFKEMGDRRNGREPAQQPRRDGAT
jgi:Flp pilus assembly protein TadD